MHLVPDLPTPNVSLSTTHLDVQGRAANDSRSEVPYSDAMTAHANLLVAGVVGRVAARAASETVGVELSLAHGDPIIYGDRAQIEFAVAGVLAAQFRALEENDGGTVRVEVTADTQDVTISITADDVPPLRFVRAVAAVPGAGADATLLHCRRVLEQLGGTLELTEHDGQLGFSIALPRMTLSPNIRLLPLARREAELPNRKLAA